MRLLVTGGAGFIGSAIVRLSLENPENKICNIDKLTYAGNLDSLPGTYDNAQYSHKICDICDSQALSKILAEFRPEAIMHLAAESHVDRSIDSPSEFITTNVFGTFHLLEAARKYHESLDDSAKKVFRFHHVSTDEVYGDLENPKEFFTENTSYAPSSPYSASKASSDHLVRAWGRTYGLPIIVTNCSNNYGPYHFPEKLIPHIILSALKGQPLPIYGDGSQIRDWLFVEDHARALLKVVAKGKIGETYNIGGNNEKSNLEVVEAICDLLEELTLSSDKSPNIKYYRDLITFVEDRPGHDARYAIDASKIQRELDWRPSETFETGLRKTVQWYLDNRVWWERVLSGDYMLKRRGDRI